MAELPPVDWLQRADLARLVEALGEGNARWVGGAVRDTLLGHDVADIDAATPLPPEEVMQRLGAAGVKTVPTGIDHGTVTAVLPGGNVEITTLRRDVSTDGRRAIIAFADDWREDAARRDFTINALYCDPHSRALFDYFGGLEDLAARRVRFIGDAHARIREDHLRILRYYRFQARFGSTLDDAAEEACASLAPMLKGLSRERVATELLNLLALPDPQPTIARMLARGVLPVILPEAGESEVTALARVIAAERAHGIAPHPLRRLAALLPAEPATAGQVAARLRLSNAFRKRLTLLAGRGESESGETESAGALAYRVGREEAIDLLLLTDRDPASLRGWEAPVFPLKGGEVVARGVGPGPEVARVLQSVERRWVGENFPSRARVEQLLDAELAASAGENAGGPPR